MDTQFVEIFTKQNLHWFLFFLLGNKKEPLGVDAQAHSCPKGLMLFWPCTDHYQSSAAFFLCSWNDAPVSIIHENNFLKYTCLLLCSWFLRPCCGMARGRAQSAHSIYLPPTLSQVSRSPAEPQTKQPPTEKMRLSQLTFSVSKNYPHFKEWIYFQKVKYVLLT